VTHYTGLIVVLFVTNVWQPFHGIPRILADNRRQTAVLFELSGFNWLWLKDLWPADDHSALHALSMSGFINFGL